MTVIDMQKLNEEKVSAEQFIKFTDNEKRNIKNLEIVVDYNNLNNLKNSEMAYFIVKWDNPKYVSKF